MAEQEYCPTCNSEIKIEGEGNQQWIDDPILTPLGLSGEEYKGILIPNLIHIEELRDYYNNLESELGLAITSWTNDLIDVTKKFILQHIHIEELRLAIEKILENKNSSLSDYFNAVGRSNTDWTDIDRDNEGNLPLFPAKTIIRAIHIEELRIGLRIGWIENWNPSEVKSYVSFSHTLTAEGVSPAWSSPILIGSLGRWTEPHYDNQSFALTAIHPHLISGLSATGIVNCDIIEQEEGNNYISLFLSSALSGSITFNEFAQANAKHHGNFAFDFPHFTGSSINIFLKTYTILKFDSIGISLSASSGFFTGAWIQVSLGLSYKGYLEQIILEESTKISDIFIQVAHPTYIDEVFGIYDNPDGTGTNYFTGGYVADPRNGIIRVGTPFTASIPYVTYNYRYGSYPINTVRTLRYEIKTGNPLSLPPTSSFVLSSFSNFRRNLWNDFDITYGDPSQFVITSLTFKGFVSSNINYNNTNNNSSVTLKIDNIKIT